MGREVPVKAGKWTGRGLSGAALKRFAVISMFADHFARPCLWIRRFMDF